MTTKHEIEIPDLPEGWRAVAYRTPQRNEYYLADEGVIQAAFNHLKQWLIVEKIKPRRIVLEKTGEVRRALPGEWCENEKGEIWYSPTRVGVDHKIWRVVEEE